jgi:ribosome recycling factor
MTANSLQSIQHDTQERMTRALEALKREFLTVRTGRASAAILEGVRVDAYNSQMPVNQLATIVIPDAKTLEIKPWDVSLLAEIERTLLKANLGITPMNDGKLIRLSFPALNEERRKELVKHVQKLAEDIRVELRNHRRKSMETLKNLKKDKQLSEDDEKAAEARIQKLTDDFIKQVDALVQHKEKELMEV